MENIKGTLKVFLVTSLFIFSTTVLLAESQVSDIGATKYIEVEADADASIDEYVDLGKFEELFTSFNFLNTLKQNHFTNSFISLYKIEIEFFVVSQFKKLMFLGIPPPSLNFC